MTGQVALRVAPYEPIGDVVLRDGSTVRVRPVTQSDAKGIRELVEGLSDRSRSFRFFSGGASVRRFVEWALDVDNRDRCGLVALSDGRIVGHAASIRIERGWAEIAFEVADDWHGRGLATVLLGKLAEIARANGIAMFKAEVLPENHQMLDVFRDSGFEVEVRSRPDVVVLQFPTALSDQVRGRFEERDRLAAQRSLSPFTPQ